MYIDRDKYTHLRKGEKMYTFRDKFIYRGDEYNNT